jgi:hypothetical protein
VLTLKANGSWPTPSDGCLYLAVNYFDKGYGRLGLTFKNNDSKNAKPDKYTQVVLTDSGKWATAFMRLNNLSATPSELRLSLEKNKGGRLIVSQADIRNTPFENPHFQYILAEDWKRPYTGPSAPNIDNRTLKGKVMVGYQGWFRTPNDPDDRGWVHWGGINQGTFSVDMWPHTSLYPPEALEKAADVKTKSGAPGYLFSSSWPEVVQTQFSWMKRYHIDGAFVQRFVPSGAYAVNGHEEWVLGNVRAAANKEGRIWAVEYDVSGGQDDKLLDFFKKDWAWLVDNFGIKKDPSYAHENGKLVVFIWGLPFADRKFSVETSNAVVDFFKNDPVYGGNYVIGGIPSQWRRMDDSWQQHFKKYDGILGWMSKSYEEDVADFKKMKIDYYPHVWPGFSWANLKHIPTGSKDQYTPREGGKYFEDLISKAVHAGVDRLFVGMFDEYDESTAIMPMSDDSPPTPERPGAMAKFYPTPRWQENPMTERRPTIELALDGTSPIRHVPGQDFSMRWEGVITPPADGNYTLELQGADGDSASLWIDNQRVLEVRNFGALGAKTKTANLAWTANKRVIYRLDYAHKSTNGTMRLLWQGPSISRGPIPASVLTDAWGRFLDNDGKRADLYMIRAGEAGEMIRGTRPPDQFSSR